MGGGIHRQVSTADLVRRKPIHYISHSEAPVVVEDAAPSVGVNLRRLRSRRGLTLERLAQRSGVSRAMLSQIELGQSAPTINLLWKVARALDVTFSALITQHGAAVPTVLSASAGKLLTT